jgi:hypothetical protein
MVTLSLDAESPGSRVSPAEMELPTEFDGKVFASCGVAELPGSPPGVSAKSELAILSLDPDWRVAAGGISGGNGGAGFGCTLTVCYEDQAR